MHHDALSHDCRSANERLVKGILLIVVVRACELHARGVRVLPAPFCFEMSFVDSVSRQCLVLAVDDMGTTVLLY
jgi:hypothetical protein